MDGECVNAKPSLRPFLSPSTGFIRPLLADPRLLVQTTRGRYPELVVSVWPQGRVCVCVCIIMGARGSAGDIQLCVKVSAPSCLRKQMCSCPQRWAGTHFTQFAPLGGRMIKPSNPKRHHVGPSLSSDEAGSCFKQRSSETTLNTTCKAPKTETATSSRRLQNNYQLTTF